MHQTYPAFFSVPSAWNAFTHTHLYMFYPSSLATQVKPLRPTLTEFPSTKFQDYYYFAIIQPQHKLMSMFYYKT